MTTGFTKPSAMISATSETHGIKDSIGLNSFLMSTTSLFLDRGVTSAIFQMVGGCCSGKEVFRISVMI